MVLLKVVNFSQKYKKKIVFLGRIIAFIKKGYFFFLFCQKMVFLVIFCQKC